MGSILHLNGYFYYFSENSMFIKCSKDDDYWQHRIGIKHFFQLSEVGSCAGLDLSSQGTQICSKPKSSRFVQTQHCVCANLIITREGGREMEPKIGRRKVLEKCWVHWEEGEQGRHLFLICLVTRIDYVYMNNCVVQYFNPYSKPTSKIYFIGCVPPRPISIL